ncbi:DUF5615 family PIN-like protein [Candidatus Viridilinea mediisalina]|uniref:DUF5615 domain-containing protein n=1 Tax=Candidatus Viridilinea mediisalina TaxID=2024553 RepID=A0A2A6RPL9_9CHLR|nr:DUF5615 family PIN-like protein [Candidatus Viridilinea mediisalina]PDW05064.1 hypothetical protein CJ255_00285 [Candidatus Viridilinea mediisalina]
MRVLLDECVTRHLKREFIGQEVHTVEEAGLKGLQNGRLLQAASGKYDVLVTVDQNVRYQQNFNATTIAVIILKARRSTYPLLKPLMPKVLALIARMKPGEVVVVD